MAMPPRLRDRLRSRALVAEAAVLLLMAKVLVRLVPFGWWRGSLGRIGQSAPPSPQKQQQPLLDRRRRLVALAVNQAAQRLPGPTLCLPRAMAVQWMLRRRQLASAMVFGMEIGADQGAQTIASLHTWIETAGVVVIGDDPDRTYARSLTLIQP